MADLTDEQLKRAEARGRKILETEPRAIKAHYDLAAGRIVVENGLIPGLDMEALRRDAQELVTMMLNT